jgi:hypothetical protein
VEIKRFAIKIYAPTCAAERRFLESLRRWKKAENNSNVLQCNIELKVFRNDHRFNRRNK